MVKGSYICWWLIKIMESEKKNCSSQFHLQFLIVTVLWALLIREHTGHKLSSSSLGCLSSSLWICQGFCKTFCFSFHFSPLIFCAILKLSCCNHSVLWVFLIKERLRGNRPLFLSSFCFLTLNNLENHPAPQITRSHPLPRVFELGRKL